MTLRQLRKRYRSLFYKQSWFDGEAFMDAVLPHAATLSPPRGALPMEPDAYGAEKLPLAVELCWQYVNAPGDPVWTRYLWCRDVDSHGQRIFIGVNNGLMEIHRHLRISERFGVPVFT